MFAKTRLALLVGWVTGGVAFPLLAQKQQKRNHRGHFADAERRDQNCHPGYRDPAIGVYYHARAV